MIKSKYEDILNLPHHVSNIYPHMSTLSRAAQFSPFAALNGYDRQVEEISRITSKRKDIDEDLKLIINNKLQVIQKNINLHPMVTITYFVSDKRKDGGKYITMSSDIKKIDSYNHVIVFTNNVSININDIIDINGDITKNNKFV